MAKRVLSMDLETFSDVDLPNCGVHRYVEGDFHILLFAYAFDDEEIEPGVFCFAVPIIDSNKNCIAAASVSMNEEPSPELAKHMIDVMKTAASRISKML